MRSGEVVVVVVVTSQQVRAIIPLSSSRDIPCVGTGEVTPVLWALLYFTYTRIETIETWALA